ncbi:MAG: porin [Rhodocyclaceae bacterium]
MRGALACLFVLLCSTAHAQFDYDYYGIADVSYGHIAQAGIRGETRLNSNSLSPSFIGVTGSYGFDGGWTVAGAAETFLRFQDRKTGRRDSDPMLSRNAFVSLRSPYGNLRYGRLQSLLFDTTNRFNALGNSIFSPPIRALFFSGNLEGVQGDFYWDRAFAYTSPTLEGGTLNLMYATQKGLKRGKYSSGSLVWAIGLLGVEFAAQDVRVDDGVNDPTKENAWQVGANYNFGFMKLFALYSRTSDRCLASPDRNCGNHVRSDNRSVGASVPAGPGSVLFQYGYSKAESEAIERRHTITSAAYVYSYDSNIDIYVIGMDDRVQDLTVGQSAAAGVRVRF